MTSIIWDPKAREFLRRLSRADAKRIFIKVDTEICKNVERYLERLFKIDANKIRIGEYRLFVDYYKDKDKLIIRTIRHRRDAYKRR